MLFVIVHRPFGAVKPLLDPGPAYASDEARCNKILVRRPGRPAIAVGPLMAGVVVTADVEGLNGVLGRLDAMGRAEFYELLEGLGALGVAQTQRRIQEEKTGPDGAAWAPTSDGRGALFVTGSHLSDSIAYEVGSGEVMWGTGWIGAGVHQFGATIVPKNAKALRFEAGGETVFAKSVTIPARPYVGLSAENEAQMMETAALFLERYVE